MSQGVKVSVTEVAGEEKSRVVKKGFVLLILFPCFGLMMGGTGYLLQSLANDWICVYCGEFNEKRYSALWFILSHGFTLAAYLLYKWAKKNEENKAQKEALERAGKVAVLERLLEGDLSAAEIEEIRESAKVVPVARQAKTQALKQPNTVAATHSVVAPNPDPPQPNATLLDRLLSRMDEMQRKIDEKQG